MSATVSEPRCADNPAAAIFRELAAPLPADEVRVKPQVGKGKRALAIAYIDARAVMDRLDAVVGVHNRLPPGRCLCRAPGRRQASPAGRYTALVRSLRRGRLFL